MSRAKRLRVSLDFGDRPIPVGELAADARSDIYFEFDPAFPLEQLPLSPEHLPRTGRLYHFPEYPGSFHGLPGVFADSLPDAWGLRLMDRAFARHGVAPSSIHVLDRLAYIGGHGLGALRYQPELPMDATQDRAVDLRAAERMAREVLEGDADQVIDAFLAAGVSPGGARPKVLVQRRGDDRWLYDTAHRYALDEGPDEGEPWIIKFPGPRDFDDLGNIEYAYSRMARDAGIEMPDTALLEGRCFAVKRFDVEEGRRLHMHSLAGLLHVPHERAAISYDDLLQVTLNLTGRFDEAAKAYRLAVFNVLSHNRDDHIKNVAFLMDATGRWRLAPAFDLVYSAGLGGHAMAVNGAVDGITRDDLFQLAIGVGLDGDEAARVIDEVGEVVARWEAYAEVCGVSAQSRREIAEAMARR